jgi:hypothetical protein
VVAAGGADEDLVRGDKAGGRAVVEGDAVGHSYVGHDLEIAKGELLCLL